MLLGWCPHCPLKGNAVSQATQNSNEHQTQPFDLDKALTHMDGDQELLHNLVQVFIEESAGQLAAIQEGIQEADAGAVERAAHAIKGAVGNFAAQRSYDLAYHLEILGRERRFNDLPQAFAELEQELKSLKEALQHALIHAADG